MPVWVYNTPFMLLAVVMIGGIEAIALGGLVLVRRKVLPRLHFHDGVNDAVSGTVQAIGVFYGVTVGLIAVGVWSTSSNANALVSQEAVDIATLYRDVSSLPEPIRTTLRAQLRDYTVEIIEQDWPAQRQERITNAGTLLLDQFQATLMSFEPSSAGDQERYAQTLTAFNAVVQQRRLRIDAVEGGLSPIMWGVILIGAAISISVGYFFYFEDVRLHATMIALIAGFLAVVIVMIVLQDRPFVGDLSVSPASYQLILDTLLNSGH